MNEWASMDDQHSMDDYLMRGGSGGQVRGDDEDSNPETEMDTRDPNDQASPPPQASINRLFNPRPSLETRQGAQSIPGHATSAQDNPVNGTANPSGEWRLEDMNQGQDRDNSNGQGQSDEQNGAALYTDATRRRLMSAINGDEYDEEEALKEGTRQSMPPPPVNVHNGGEFERNETV